MQVAIAPNRPFDLLVKASDMTEFEPCSIANAVRLAALRGAIRAKENVTTLYVTSDTRRSVKPWAGSVNRLGPFGVPLPLFHAV